jgi:hypothetical protein
MTAAPSTLYTASPHAYLPGATLERPRGAGFAVGPASDDACAFAAWPLRVYEVGVDPADLRPTGGGRLEASAGGSRPWLADVSATRACGTVLGRRPCGGIHLVEDVRKTFRDHTGVELDEEQVVLVGSNPLPVVVAALALRPARGVHLIYTAEVEKRTLRIAELVEQKGVPVQRGGWSSG